MEDVDQVPGERGQDVRDPHEQKARRMGKGCCFKQTRHFLNLGRSLPQLGYF